MTQPKAAAHQRARTICQVGTDAKSPLYQRVHTIGQVDTAQGSRVPAGAYDRPNGHGRPSRPHTSGRARSAKLTQPKAAAYQREPTIGQVDTAQGSSVPSGAHDRPSCMDAKADRVPAGVYDRPS